MRFLPLLVLLAALLPASALEVKIDSADADNTASATAKPVSRQLEYKEKDKTLIAVVEYRDDLHSTVTGIQDDTLFFHFPGVRFDPQDQTLYVETPDNAVIPIGEWRKGVFGGRQVLLYINTVILVSSRHGNVQLTLDIDTERTAEAVDKTKKKQEQEESDAQTYTLDSVLHGKSGN